ncbi:MAG: hypothetical protein AVDCRST_MAG40-354, partial [uncultured Gemmatimonadaceae bacterium]
AYLFAIVRGVAFQEDTPDPYDLETQNLYFFIGRNYLVTVHAGPAPACVAQTIGVDTGCGYPGGRLSALQWPEGVVRSVAGPVPPEPMGRPAGSARRL